ncbi:hypothetical protein QBC39DRAFT_186818 [Podospora conica]|nr:hypothetical protein QBC39DRAFT_186818 [Schizothecium conicum]
MGAQNDAVVAKPTSSKRKRTSASSSAGNQHQSPKKKAKKQAPKQNARKQSDDDADEAPEEKRLRRFRSQAPKAFEEIHERATTQRFYVLSRQRGGTPECPEETVQITGTTGNIYSIHIARQPLCDCPQGVEKKQCKHIIYVLARVLRAKPEYVYQLALLSSELRDIFSTAPPADNQLEANEAANNNRKPLEGDCPICFNEMEAQGEAIVWCRAACGQNVHKSCFEMWAATKRQQQAVDGGHVDVTCPYCRSVWQGDEDMVKKIEKTGPLNAEGYVNVAEQLGISDERDPSNYSRWWKGHPRAYRRRT